MDEVAAATLSQFQQAAFGDFARRGYRSVGQTKYDNLRLESYDGAVLDGSGILRIYVCSDVSRVDVLDSTGKSVVSPNRPARTPFEVGFDLRPAPTRTLVVSSEDVWDGGGVCD
jgi:hypothetical protein